MHKVNANIQKRAFQPLRMCDRAFLVLRRIPIVHRIGDTVHDALTTAVYAHVRKNPTRWLDHNADLHTDTLTKAEQCAMRRRRYRLRRSFVSASGRANVSNFHHTKDGAL